MSPNFNFEASSLLCEEDNDCISYESGGDDDDFMSFDWDINQSDNENNNLIMNLETEHSVLDLHLQNDPNLDLLITKESQQFVGGVDYLDKLKNQNLFLVARQQAVDWISKVHAQFNFGPLCAYISVNYLDRFLAVYELPKEESWMMQLVAVTCVSLAAKMEETEIPLILDLQACESRFVFEAKTIKRMELIVLSKLEWRMQSITPFSFIDSFKVNYNSQSQTNSRSLILKSTQLILSLIKGVDFLEFKPSEIAAAVAMSVVGIEVEKTENFALF
ncbi:cyclin-D3-1-like [Bidens hawaiensis]|uniref:cyclin-D3-1-like n=1 Tax=Bidens hawaiensis TaxID=980011 RepID=UPI00404A92A4